jgi:preprotein translocase subunit SecD
MKFNLKLTWKIWLLIIMLIFSLMSIFITPNFLKKGILITSVEGNSTAFDQGFKSGQIITQIDGEKIETTANYSQIIQSKFSSDENVKTIFTLSDGEVIYFSNSAPQITVSDIKLTNIKTGLDLSGGARALVEPVDAELSFSEITDLAGMIENRLNVYGLEDINVNPISDLDGNTYIRIEIAGATPKDLEELVSQQGRFEAKIGNQTVFTGEENDITSVARSGQDAGIESCQASGDGYFCNFRFAVYLSEEAAKRHADITENLGVNQTATGNYLDKKLDLYLDGSLLESLLISENLKGVVTTQISIQGSASGTTENEAYDNAIDQMNKLQTILITGSLPYKLEVVKLDTISPTLGKEFTRAILLAAVVALAVVTLVVALRYKKLKSSLALLLTSTSEIIIILGIAALIRWNLDLPSIAGILATIGTGIDSQIILLDESRNTGMNLKQRLKRAFSIILGAYFTAVVAMLPLYWAVAGLFKGFAFTTILGITVGVLITRPAFSDIIKKIEKE